METTPDTGIEPMIEVMDGYNTSKRELGDLEEPLLAEAIAIVSGRQTRGTAVSQKPMMLPKQIYQVGSPSFVNKFKFKYE